MGDEIDEPAGDILPLAALDLLAAAWVVLFMGRWVVVQLLLAASLLTPSMVSDLDDRLLFRCYLVLLAVTIVVLALRAVRGATARSQAAVRNSTACPGGKAHAGADAVEPADRGPNTGD